MKNTRILRKPFFTRVDMAILFCVVTALVFIGVTVKFVLQKDTYITVELLAWGGDWWWNVAPPYYWNTSGLVVGAKEYDSLHKPNVEILNVVKSEESNHTYMWIRARLLVKKNTLTGTYSFHQSVLQVGSTINIVPNNISIAGNVVGIEGVSTLWNEQYVIVTAKINSEEENQYKVKQYYRQEDADEIVVGDSIKDNNGNIIAQILNKNVAPSDVVTTTSGGEALLRQSPLYKDITLTVKLRVLRSGNNYFYNMYQPIRPGEMMNLQLTNVTLTPKILTVSPEVPMNGK